MEVLPYEILFSILLEVPNISDVLNFCSVSNVIKKVCDDEYFWKKRFEKDFPKLHFQSTENYKQLYSSFHETGIGKLLSFPSVENNNFIMLIKPEPPYVIDEIFTAYTTEIGGYINYYIVPDIICQRRASNETWRILTQPRDVPLNERGHYQRFPNRYQSFSDEELITLINEGFYEIKRLQLTEEEVEQLRQNNYILRIDHAENVQFR